MYNILKPGYSYIEDRGFITEFYIYEVNNDLYDYINEIRRSLDPNININRIPITFYIDSYGGVAEIAIDIANLIIKSPIDTIAYGYRVISAATFIFVACKNRFLYRGNYVFMLHPMKLSLDKEDLNISNLELSNYIKLHQDTQVYLTNEAINIFKKHTLLGVEYLIDILYGHTNKNDFFDDYDIMNCNIAYLL